MSGESHVNFPESPETRAWGAFLRVVAGDPALKAGRTTIWPAVGGVEDMREPTTDQMPCLQMTTGPGASGWENEGQHRSDIAVRVTLWVEGTAAADMLDFWGAFRTAIFPPYGTPRQQAVALLMGGLTENGEMLSQAFGNELVGEVACMKSVGTVMLHINVDT